MEIGDWIMWTILPVRLESGIICGDSERYPAGSAQENETLNSRKCVKPQLKRYFRQSTDLQKELIM